MTATFEQFKLKSFLNQALQNLDFKTPTTIQSKLIPAIGKGENVVGQSATGSGKTHAFLLPIFNQLDLDTQSVQAVITTPSRELAYQLYDNAKQLAQYSSQTIHIADYIGGTDKKRQIEKLNREQPQIVIGTPGRILDLINSNALDIHTASRLVVDEADMTLDLGFLDQVDKIASRFGDTLQMMVFSATVPQGLQAFLKKYMENPTVVKVPVESIISPTVDNWLISTKGKSRNNLIYKLLTMGEPYLVLIFANTRERVVEISNFLRQNGLKVAMIEGGMQPRERKRVMKQVHNLKYQFVVATDLAARGIDIEGVSHVINDAIPRDLDYFIHRVGRTGRNGMPGTAITLYEPDDVKGIDALEQKGIKFQSKEIKNDEVVDAPERNRRAKYKGSSQKLDSQTKGYIRKKKKQVKPGYKKKIKKAAKNSEKQQRRLQFRKNNKAKKRQRKQSSKRNY